MEKMNGDLISREALTDVIERTDWYHVNSKGELVLGATSATGLYRFEDIMTALENAPAVEAEPVVHAHWVKNWCDNNLIGHEYEECSACGCSMLDTNHFWDSKRCPNCGAHMDEEVSE